MIRVTIGRGAAIAVTLGLGLVACQSTPEPKEQPSETGSEWHEAPSQPSQATPPPSESRHVDLQTVYFDFDKYDIRADAKPVLRSNAEQIKSVGGTVTVEGHCDERGSEEYNLALGERRANAAKRYLVDLGVPSSKLVTVSFGEDRPAVQGHDESAWRYNRRAEFVVD
jgi:peptidoglycan-associated lipoprotein